MVEAEKIILVVADWEEASRYIKKAAEEVAKEKNIEVEIKKEDYDFLGKYGVKNEFGGLDIPQAFIKYKNNETKYVLSRVPLTDKGTPDIKKAKEIINNALEG